MTTSNDIPSAMYHYTSVKILELILSSRTIRFSSLFSMDDLWEGKSTDAEPLGRFLFVSCWAQESGENIAMWKMYSSLSSGVRIRLKTYPFKTYRLDPRVFDQYARDIAFLYSPEDKSAEHKTLFPFKELLGARYTPFHLTVTEDYLFKVQYTDESERIVPKILHKSTQELAVSMDLLGKYKKRGWEFQNEWRYILPVFPENILALSRFPEIVFSTMFDPKMAPPIDALYLAIDDAAFEAMEVTLSPSITEEDRMKVESLKERLNPEMKIHASAYAGMIR